MPNPPGYSYEAFCQGIAARDGAECWVHRLLVARRAAVIDQWGAGDAPLDGCAGWIPDGLLRCDGVLDGHHLLSKSWLKSWHATALRATGVEGRFVPAADLLDVPQLVDLLNDPRNGVLACRRHHDLIEGPTEAVKIRRADLPPCVEEFALELGDRAVARLERNFGVRAVPASTDLGGS